MDYEKAYKEALNRAKHALDCHNQGMVSTDVSLITSMFPELKESEDELTWLTKYIEEEVYILSMDIRDNEDRIKLKNLRKSLAWLEKQGEQKPINDADEEIVNAVKDTSILDLAEPKFKVGDYIVNDYCMGRVVEITDDAYLLDTEQGIPFSCHSTRLWDVTKDAKDGDVLVDSLSGDNQITILFKSIELDTSIHAYIGWNCYNFRVTTDGTGYGTLSSTKYVPATKEQRELLFKKMKEAGYRWDAEKKELKKVWQKLTELAKCEDYGIDGLYAAVDILQKTLGEVDGYQTDDGILEHECAISAVKKLYEQNPTWSEEDDYNLQCMIAKVTSDIQKGNVGRNNELIDWLKSIKERVQPQPKQEWSDEDEFRLNRTVENIELLNDANGNILFKDIEWLKSIKDRLSNVKKH